MNIFICEDNELNVKLFAAILKNEKYKKSFFEKAEDLLLRLESSVPDLILMDWGLPGMSGVEATRVIRSNPAWAHIPVVVISAHAFGEEMREAERAGATSYITKPIDFKKLISTVERFQPQQ